MALYTKKDFAEICWIKSKDLSNYIRRGKVVVGAGDMIDDAEDINRAFIQHRRSKMDVAIDNPAVTRGDKKTAARILMADDGPEPATKSRKQKPEPDTIPALPVPKMRAGNDNEADDDDDDEMPGMLSFGDDGIPALHVSERHLKHWQAEKTRKGAELDQLKIDKARGIVVPSEYIKPLFLQHNQHLITEFRNGWEEFLRQLAKTYGIPPEAAAGYRGQMVDRINAAMKKATESTVKGIDVIIKDHSEKRGVGERT